MMLSWIALVPPAAVFAFLLFLPGVSVGRLVTLRGLTLLAVAPAISVAIFGIAGIVLHRLHMRWDFQSAALITVGIMLVCGVGELLRARLWGKKIPEAPKNRFPFSLPPLGRAGVAIIFLGWLLAFLPMLVTADPRNPGQQWDPSFHLNVVYSMFVTGDGSTLSGASPVFGPGAGGAIYYPALWHQLVAATVPASKYGVVLAANASTPVIMFIWLVGCYAFSQAVFVDTKWQKFAPLTGILAGCGLAFPADQLSTYLQWPNALSLALTPGVFALSLLVGRQFKVRETMAGNGTLRLRVAGATVVLLLAALGAILAHPSAAFNALVILGPPLLYGCFNRWREFKVRAGNLWAILVAAILLVGVAAMLAVVLTNPKIAAVAAFTREPGGNFFTAVGRALIFYAPLPAGPGMIILVALMAFCTWVGVFACWRSGIRWLPIGWGIITFLGALAYGPQNPLRVLAGPWYTDARRLSAVSIMLASLLAVAGFAVLIKVLRARIARLNSMPLCRVCVGVVALFLVVTLGGGLDGRISAFEKLYVPGTNLGGNMVDQAELDWIHGTLPALLPAQSLTISDPGNGSVYLMAIAGRKVVNAHLSSDGGNAELKWLNENFKEIHTNKRVCELVNKWHIDHFYARPDRRYYKLNRSDYYPGLYGVDTSVGFTAVAQVEKTVLYRIDACK